MAQQNRIQHWTPPRRLARTERRLEDKVKLPYIRPWFTVGTVGTDGVDDAIANNVPPYNESPYVPFIGDITNAFFLDDDGNPGGPLRYRQVTNGIEIEWTGGATGSDLIVGAEVCEFVGVQLPDFTWPWHMTSLDRTSISSWSISPSGIMRYGGAVAPGFS